MLKEAIWTIGTFLETDPQSILTKREDVLLVFLENSHESESTDIDNDNLNLNLIFVARLGLVLPQIYSLYRLNRRLFRI